MRNFPHVNVQNHFTKSQSVNHLLIKSFEWVSLVAQIHVQTHRVSQDLSTFTRVQRLVGRLPDWDQNPGRRAALGTQVNCLSPKWLTGSECDWVISQMPKAESAAVLTWMSQSLTALLDSAWLSILNFCSASLPRMVTGSWLSPLGTTTGPLSDFTTWSTPYGVELGNRRFGRSRVDSLNLRKSWIVINYNKDIKLMLTCPLEPLSKGVICSGSRESLGVATWQGTQHFTIESNGLSTLQNQTFQHNRPLGKWSLLSGKQFFPH